MNNLIKKDKNNLNNLSLKDKLEFLLKNGQDIEQQDGEGKTPLILSILEYKKENTEELEVIKFLLKNNANFFHKDIYGNSPLSIAITLYLPEIVEEIIKEGIKRNKKIFSLFKYHNETILTYPYSLKKLLLKKLKNNFLCKEILENKISKETEKKLTENEKDIINKIFNLDKIIQNILLYSEYNIEIYDSNLKGYDIVDFVKYEDDQNLLNFINKYQWMELIIPESKEIKNNKLKNLKNNLNLDLDLNEDFSFL
jgi:ankyrin repeat protein